MPVSDKFIGNDPTIGNVNTTDSATGAGTGTVADIAPTTPDNPVPVPAPTTPGLTAAELNDPNSIQVTIADKKAPIVILFGPPACGKTMTLVRMTRFLKNEGYTVSPIRSFRPDEDSNYKDICDNFDQTINNNHAADTTNRISFMLVEVLRNGHRLCQILEAPGEYYFDPQHPNAGFPKYVNSIINCNNRKIWTIMVEPNWKNQQDRDNYVSRIEKLKSKMSAKDKVIFVFNKIDKTNYVRNKGHVNEAAAKKEVNDLYPNIFVPFQNQIPILRWFKPYNCDYISFQTGDYTNAVNGITFEEGPREFCVKLWKSILDKITG